MDDTLLFKYLTMNLVLAFIGSTIGLGLMMWAFYKDAKYKHKQKQDETTIKAHRRINNYLSNKY